MSDLTVEDLTEIRRREAKSAKRFTMLLFTGLLLMLPIAPSTFTVFAVFMAPTWVVACYRAFHAPGAIPTVAALNFAGTLPVLYHLWTRGNDFPTAFMLLFEIDYIIMGFGAAAIGISLLFIAPFVARTWVDMAGHRLLTQAQSERERLIDEWGEELIADEPDAREADEDGEGSDDRDGR